MSEKLTITSGQPITRVIRVVDAKNVWADIDDLEVRAQLRAEDSLTSPLISNLHEFMTWVFDVNDLVITWTMSGQNTRELYALQWGMFKTGYFNLVVSDVGTVDSRALVVPTIQIKGVDTTTTAEGDI